MFWDRELTGFGVRVYPSGGKVFVAQARGPDGPDKPNKPRRITVGRHPVLSAEQARQRAALIIARVKAGELLCGFWGHRPISRTRRSAVADPGSIHHSRSASARYTSYGKLAKVTPSPCQPLSEWVIMISRRGVMR